MTAQPTTNVRWTIHDTEALPQNDWVTYELIDGELFVSKSPHRRHQQVTHEICAALNVWSKKTGSGEAISAPGIVLSDADNVIPDVVWVSARKLALIEDEAGHLTAVPELVVEVLSPGSENIRRDKQAKLKLYSAQGAQEYWIADRFERQLEVYRRKQGVLHKQMTLMGSDTLTSPLFPGFEVPVSLFF